MTALDWMLTIIAATSFTIIVLLVIRERSHLVSIDVATLPEFKLRQQKYRLIEDRLNRKLAMHRHWLWRWISPLGVLISQGFEGMIDRLKRLERRYQTLAVQPRSEADRELNRQKVAAILEEGITLYKAGNLVEAELRFLEAIRLNPQTAPAYKYIGAIYIQKEQYEDAIESLRFADKLLDTPDARVWYNLGVAFQGLHDQEHAVESFEKAVEIDPSPKHLDMLIAAAIASEDRWLARDAWKQLHAINPDNQKLGELEKMIDQL